MVANSLQDVVIVGLALSNVPFILKIGIVVAPEVFWTAKRSRAWERRVITD